MPKVKIPTLLAAAGLALLPAVAQAHYLWIESESPSDARVFFGEYNEGKIEKSGGRLDERDALQGWLISGEGGKKQLDWKKLADHFVAKIGKASGWLVVNDLENPVMDWRKHGIGLVKPMFYARAAVNNQPVAAKPVLTLDILPVAGEKLAYQVFFKGKPMAGIKGYIYAPNLWMREIKTDENGRFTVLVPWPGRYVIDVIHKEMTPGKFKGKPFEGYRHRVTYSFTKPR